MSIHDRHIELVEAVNAAVNAREHELAEARLHGFRIACDLLRPGHRLRLGADQFYIDEGIDRPMCCGVWLDWEPTLEPSGGGR